MAFEDDALGMIARAADGGLRDALSLTDQVLSLGESGHVTAERVRIALGLIADDEYLALLDLIIERRAVEIFPAMQRLADEGVDFTLVISGLANCCGRNWRSSSAGRRRNSLSACARRWSSVVVGSVPAICCACCMPCWKSSRCSGAVVSRSCCWRRYWCDSRCSTGPSNSRKY